MNHGSDVRRYSHNNQIFSRQLVLYLQRVSQTPRCGLIRHDIMRSHSSTSLERSSRPLILEVALQAPRTRQSKKQTKILQFPPIAPVHPWSYIQAAAGPHSKAQKYLILILRSRDRITSAVAKEAQSAKRASSTKSHCIPATRPPFSLEDAFLNPNDLDHSRCLVFAALVATLSSHAALTVLSGLIASHGCC